MADQHDLVAGIEVALRFNVHLRDKRAGGVDEDHLARPRLRRHRFRHAMGGEDDRPIHRAVVQFFDEHSAQPLQPLNHVAVVDNLVADIDRRAPLPDRLLNDLDGPVDPRAEAARGG